MAAEDQSETLKLLDCHVRQVYALRYDSTCKGRSWVSATPTDLGDRLGQDYDVSQSNGMRENKLGPR